MGTIGLLTPSKAYKPFRYGWCMDAWKQQQQIHWLPEEVPLGEDVKDWAVNLTEPEKNLLTQIFRFFTQADIDVNDNYMDRYAQVFKPTEVKMMLSAFSNMECFDDQTELLTSKGWKSVVDISEQDLIAQYNIETGNISFALPKRVVSYPYKGIMHHYKSVTTDICVTPNHDLIIQHPTSKKVQKVKSFERALGGNYLYPASGKSTYIHEDLTDLERLLIAIQADGCLRGLCPSAGQWRTVDFTLHKKRKIERLTQLLFNCGIYFTFKECENSRTRISFRLPDRISIESIKEFDFIELDKISPVKAMQILEEVIHWDGSVNHYTEQKIYYTSSARAAGKIQALASLTGEVMATVGVGRKAGTQIKLPGDREYEITKDQYVVTFVEDRIHKTYPYRDEVDYDGRVYCVSVDTENLISRRNGKVAFTGNTVHIAGYAHLLETIGMPDVEFQAFMEYEAMKAKHDFNLGFDTSSPSDTARTLAVFGAFVEGLQLFASFAMLMNFPRHNRMKGMGQIISWSVRDESLHAESMIKLYHTYVAEAGVNAQIEWLEPQLVRDCRKIVELEDKFIDLAFELGPVKGMTPDDIKAYIRFIADWRLRQLRLEPIYGVTENPLPWLQAMLSGFEFANFFESRATEYAKGATKGSWDGPDGVWAMFDEAQKKKAGG